jgi:preprotein translocase subunit YajC
MFLFTLLAQQGDGGSGSAFGALLPFLLIMVVGYFLLFRPMQRQKREHEAMVKALKKNDKVVAAGGILGSVASIKDNEDEVTLKVDDNVRIRVLRSSIVKVIRPEESPDKITKEPKESDGG